MIKLEPFTSADFDRFISWVDSKELLITIAGTVLTYPLTVDQLENYLNDQKSISFNVIDTSQNKPIGHAEIILVDGQMVKLDKVLIGDKSQRGNGYGQKVIEALLQYSFDNLGSKTVELNVYDWNIGAIKCYEKCGFLANPNKLQKTEVNNETWTAINMTVEQEKWRKYAR